MASLHLELLHLAQNEHSDANPLPLLQKGANPNFRDPHYHKWTPLHYSVFLNREHFALQLIAHAKTNVHLLDSDGFSALYWAAKKSTARVIRALLIKGCDPNQRDMHGMTALFAAVAAQKTENVQELLAHAEIDVNQPNQFGGSALHHTAFATDNVRIAELLVDAGANLFLYDFEKMAPLHVARLRKHLELFRFLRQRMQLCEPSWTCDVSEDGWNSETGTENSTSEEKDSEPRFRATKSERQQMQQNRHDQISSPQQRYVTAQMSALSIAPRTHLKLRNHGSTDSNTSSYSAGSNGDRSDRELIAKSVRREARKQSKRDKIAMAKSVPIQHAQTQPQSQSHQSSHTASLWSVQQQRLQQMQDMADGVSLSREARNLVMEQRRCFQREREAMFASLQNFEVQLKHVIQLNKQLGEENVRLKQYVGSLPGISTVSTNTKTGQRVQVVVAKKSKANKSKREFRKWFKRQIGEDFMIYYEQFARAGFDDLRTVRHIHHEHELADLGIELRGHRLHILDKIEGYRLQYNQSALADVAKPAMAAADSEQEMCEPLNVDAVLEADVEGCLKTE